MALTTSMDKPSSDLEQLCMGAVFLGMIGIAIFALVGLVPFLIMGLALSELLIAPIFFWAWGFRKLALIPILVVASVGWLLVWWSPGLEWLNQALWSIWFDRLLNIVSEVKSVNLEPAEIIPLWYFILPFGIAFAGLRIWKGSVSNSLSKTLLKILSKAPILGQVYEAEKSQHNLSKRGVFIGDVEGKPFHQEFLTDQQLNHHVHVVGASGYGKSVLLSKIIKDRIQRGKGLLFIDLKADRETIAQVKQYCGDSSRGSDLKIFSISNPDISNSYNPFLEGTANQIRDRMIGALEWSEEFYKQSSSSHLLKVLRFLCWRRDEQGTSFHVKDILDLISRSDTVELYLDGIDPAPAEIQVLASDLMAFFESRERVNALMGIRCQLESLVESDFSRLLTSEESDISLFDDINAGKIVYMLLDSRRYGESARVMGKLILGDLKAASSRIDSEVEKRNRKSFNVIVDEFADLATNDFLAFLDRARSAKIGVVMAHQELGDLKRVSGEFAQRLMGNTSTLYAFLQKNPDSAETISQIAGTKEQVEYTSQMERQGFWHVATGAMSARVVEAFRVHPNQIKSLSVGRCVVLGQMPRQRAVCVKIAL